MHSRCCTRCTVCNLPASSIRGQLVDPLRWLAKPCGLWYWRSHVACDIGLLRLCRLSPYGEFGDVADDKPNATNRYLTEQLNGFGLAYLHMVEPRIAGYLEVEVTDNTFDLGHFRKLYNGTFIAAGMPLTLLGPLMCSNSLISAYQQGLCCAKLCLS